MNKKGMSYMTTIFILTIAIMGYAFQQVGTEDAQKAVDNLKANLTWKHIEINTTESQPEIGFMAETYINALGDIFFTLVKWGMDIAAENPSVAWKWIVYLIILSLLAPIVIVLFKLSVIIFILTKEFFQSRKEKKLIKK